jgi:hypothetical protein
VARHYKKWEEHSPRWQREARKGGLTPQRWNGWLKLSEKTRKETDPRKYAKGQTVAAQRRERKERDAAARIKSVSKRSRISTIQRNVSRMKEDDLDWTLKATPEQIRKKASQKHVPGYAVNPWWYV